MKYAAYPVDSHEAKIVAHPDDNLDCLRITISLAPTTTEVPPGQCSTERYDFGEVLRLSNLFYEAQRSGKLPADNRIPWRGDSSLGDVGNNGEDLTGGYHDGKEYHDIT